MSKKTAVIAVMVSCLMLLQDMTINAKEMITRAEFADRVMDTYEYVTQEFSVPMSEQVVFNDIEQSPLALRILQAYSYRFMFGVGDEKFSPDECVTRCQAVVTLYRVVQRLNEKYNIIEEKSQIYVPDIETVPDWGIESVEYMVSAGLMSLRPEGFCPDELVSEDELNEIMQNIKDIFGGFYDGERIDFETFLERFSENE